jgi:MFS family permease
VQLSKVPTCALNGSLASTVVEDGTGQSGRHASHRWLIVAVVGVTQVAAQGISFFLFSLLLVSMQHDLSWSTTELAGAYSLSFLVFALIITPIGHYVDLHGARAVTAAGWLLTGACLCGIAVMREPWQFYLLWGFGLGTAQALTSAQVGSTVITDWFDRRRGTAFAWITLITGLTPALFVPVASWLILRTGWRPALVLLGVGCAALFIPLSGVLTKRREDDRVKADRSSRTHEAPSPSTKDGDTLRLALHSPALWVLCSSSLLLAIAAGIVNTHQIAFMLTKGFGLSVAATVIAIAGVVSLPLRFGLNAAADWVGAKRTLIFAFAAQTAGILILIWANSALMLAGYAIVYGSSMGAVFGLRSMLLADLFGRRAYGAIAAVLGACVYVGTAIGPTLAGVLFDHLHSYQAAFFLATAMVGVSALGLLGIRSQRPLLPT